MPLPTWPVLWQPASRAGVSCLLAPHLPGMKAEPAEVHLGPHRSSLASQSWIAVHHSWLTHGHQLTACFESSIVVSRGCEMARLLHVHTYPCSKLYISKQWSFIMSNISTTC